MKNVQSISRCKLDKNRPGSWTQAQNIRLLLHQALVSDLFIEQQRANHAASAQQPHFL